MINKRVKERYDSVDESLFKKIIVPEKEDDKYKFKDEKKVKKFDHLKIPIKSVDSYKNLGIK